MLQAFAVAIDARIASRKVQDVHAELVKAFRDLGAPREGPAAVCHIRQSGGGRRRDHFSDSGASWWKIWTLATLEASFMRG